MNEFIAIDFETGTESPDSAISVGLVKFCNYKPMASYYSLVKPPELYIRPDFTRIHGLVADDVKNAPDFKYIWENELHGFFGDVPLVAHNAAFDMNVLCAVLRYYDLSIPDTRYFCTLKLSRRVWPDLRSHSLKSLAREFNITYDAHNAVADADTCARIVTLSAEKISALSKRKTQLPLDGLLKKAGVKMMSLNDSVN